LAAGVKDVISKPFDLAELKTRIFIMLEVRLLCRKLERHNEEMEQAVLERTAELRESEARDRGLTDLASDWYWEQDDRGEFTRVSGPAMEMLGLRVPSLQGNSSDAMPDGWVEAERRELLENIAARRPFLDFLFHRTNADGSQQQFRVSGQPMFDRACLFLGYRGIGVEVMPGRSTRDSARSPMPSHNPNQNHLLATLPTAAFESLSADLELVPMRLGDMPYAPGKHLQHAYFPTTAVVSLHGITGTGESVETTDVGREGMIGISLFMGGRSTTGSAVVQTGGHGYRLDPRILSLTFDQGGLLQRAPLRYTLALMTQIAQTAVCYRHHSVEQQLGRWLLSTADRLPEGALVMTQELVAGLLGVRRESVTDAAGRLRDAGYIRYRRRHLSILDPIGLQTRACECYGVVKKELARLRLPLANGQDLVARPMR